MKTAKRTLVCLLLLAEMLPFYCLQAQELTHVKGIHAIGVRGGIGTKNKYDVGLTYNYHFNSNMALCVEVDHEKAQFGHSEFTNILLLSPGVDYSPFNPWNWSYLTINLSASVGYDRWTCLEIHEKKSGIVYGANTGISWEVIPWHFLSFVIKAQEYILFGNNDQYLKPLFTLGIRYNFHK